MVIPELQLYNGHATTINISNPEYDAEITKECLLEKYTIDPSVYSYVSTHISHNNWGIMRNYDRLFPNTFHKEV